MEIVIYTWIYLSIFDVEDAYKRRMDVCVCIYVRMQVCMYTCVHVYMYACIHVCMHVFWQCMYACMYVCMYVFMHVCCVCIHTHTHTHTLLYTHTHTCVCVCVCVCVGANPTHGLGNDCGQAPTLWKVYSSAKCASAISSGQWQCAGVYCSLDQGSDSRCRTPLISPRNPSPGARAGALNPNPKP